MKTFWNRYTEALKESKRPIVLVGRGVRCADAIGMFKVFTYIYKIPVVTSLLGLDVLPFGHKQRVGFIGTYGNRWANYALGKCDLLLVLGSRLDNRQTGELASFKKDKRIFHVDIDDAELNNRIAGCDILKADVYGFLEFANMQSIPIEINADWLREIGENKNQWSDVEEQKHSVGINPNFFIHKLSQVSQQASVIVADVGNNQMWAAQSLELGPFQQFITSGGMGAMGYALPASIGASMANKKSPIVCISGDGGFQINIQELQTITKNCLPIKMIVLNNDSLGMVRQFQDDYFEKRHQSTIWGYSAPCFTKVAKAYGISGVSISAKDEIVYGLSKLWKDMLVPYLLEVMIGQHTNVYPKIAWGKPLTEMYP